MSDWIIINSKFQTKCKVCFNNIEAGDQCLWKKGEGVKHVEGCESNDVGFREDKSALVIISDDEWKDFKQYSMDVLRKISNCQKCGVLLQNQQDKYINNERRTCEMCFSA